MRIKREETAALVIDYQVKLMPAIHEKELLIRNSAKLLKGLRALQVPRIITQQYTAGLGATISELWDAAGVEKYYEKNSFSCYPAPGVKEVLEGTYKTVLLCGIETHICVQQTALELLENGYQVLLAVDCVSSRHPVDKKVAVKRMIQAGVIPVTGEAILYELMESSESPAFKEILKIVKNG